MPKFHTDSELLEIMNASKGPVLKGEHSVSPSRKQEKEAAKCLVLQQLKHRLKNVINEEWMEDLVGSPVLEQPKVLLKTANVGQVLESENYASPSRKQRRIMEILEFYDKHYNFTVPRKVLIDKSFCRHMLRQAIRKQDLCDLLLSKDVELNITSCNTGELMLYKIENEDQRKATLIELALCLSLIRCGHLDSCLDACKCVESVVQHGNSGCYFVATADKSFVKVLLELPGVAVISVKRGGKLILKEASLSQKKFAEKNTHEIRKRKKDDLDLGDETEMKVRNVRVKFQTEGVMPKLQKTEVVMPKLQKKNVEKDLVPSNENRGCKTLFMGNLNSTVKEKDVHDFFETIGRIHDVRLSQRKNRFVPFAHVEFLTVEAARQLKGRYVRLDDAEKRLKMEEILGAIGKMPVSGLVGGSRGSGYGIASRGSGYGIGSRGTGYGRGSGYGRGNGGSGYGRGHGGSGYGRGHGGGGYGVGRHGGFR